MTAKNPLIGALPRETLENAVNILELLQYLDFSVGIDKKAEFGLYLMHQMLAEALVHVSDELKPEDNKVIPADDCIDAGSRLHPEQEIEAGI